MTVLRHRVCMHAHWLASTRALAINRWHLLHFALTLSFFAARVLRLSLFFPPFFYPPFFFPPLWHARRRGRGRRAARLVCSRKHKRAYVSTHRYAGGKRVRASRDANYLFYVPTGTPWEVRSSFRVTPARVRTSAVPNGTGLPLSSSVLLNRACLLIKRNIWIFHEFFVST